MSDPVAEHIGTLEHNNRNLSQKCRELTAQLAQCARERTQSAEYAVNVENQVHDLIEERQLLITSLQHLYDHLTGYVESTPCEIIHPRIKEYVK